MFSPPTLTHILLSTNRHFTQLVHLVCVCAHVWRERHRRDTTPPRTILHYVVLKRIHHSTFVRSISLFSLTFGTELLVSASKNKTPTDGEKRPCRHPHRHPHQHQTNNKRQPFESRRLHIHPGGAAEVAKNSGRKSQTVFCNRIARKGRVDLSRHTRKLTC